MAADAPDQPKTVLFLIGTLTVGGAEQVLIDTALGLDRKRYRPVVCSLSGPAEFDHKLAGTGVKHILLHKKPGFSPGILLPLLRVLREENVEILHSHLFTGNFWGRLAGLLHGTSRVFTTEHSLDAWKGRGRLLLDLWMAPMARAVICVSDSVRDFYVRDVGIDPKRIAVIHNGISPPASTPSRSRADLGLPATGPLVGTVGRMTPAKDYATWLRAFLLLCSRRPDVHGVIVGDGECRGDIERMTEELQLRDRLTLLGHRDDIHGIYPLFDVFMLASLREGFPIAVLESMWHGVPVAATDVGGMREIVKDEGLGCIAPPQNPAALAAATERLLDDSALRENIARRGRALVRAEFTVDAMVRKIQTLYEAPAGGL